jgi:molecular chaperone HscA
MALLQIAEPGMSTAPHQHRLAVGIDLGTTNSLVATVRSGMAMVLDDEAGRSLLPSIVRYHPNGEVEVGYAAQSAQNRDPHNTIASVKRFMGRGLDDIEDVASLPYRFVDAPGMVQLKTASGIKSPVARRWAATTSTSACSAGSSSRAALRRCRRATCGCC